MVLILTVYWFRFHCVLDVWVYCGGELLHVFHAGCNFDQRGVLRVAARVYDGGHAFAFLPTPPSNFCLCAPKTSFPVAARLTVWVLVQVAEK